MCNRFGSKAKFEAYQALMDKLNLKLSTSCSIPNLEPRDEIKPTEKAPVIRQVATGLDIREMRFGLIPHFHKGAAKEYKLLNTNARAETVKELPTFSKAFRSQRCLVPFSHFFEWNGPKDNRVKWQFTPKGNDLLCFAGIWDKVETTHGIIESFSILTKAAGEEIAPYHDRQPIILATDQCKAWLNCGPVPKSKIGYDLIISDNQN